MDETVTSKDSVTVVETDIPTILSSIHGRQRRMERNIAKSDLYAAVRYGKKEKANYGYNGEKRWKYTFADVVFITDSTSTKEVTSWILPACGVDVEKVDITKAMLEQHDRDVKQLQDRSTWTSHTVVVVDQSGSMRKTDTDDALSRSDLVWLVLALTLVGDKLKTGERKSTDVFSLLIMRDGVDVSMKFQPFDWVLYNALVDLLRTSHPCGGGFYLPALDRAQMLLNENNFGSCALLLMFLSDGRPSDKMRKGDFSSIEKLGTYVQERMEKLASRFGARLTVGAIALGQAGSDEFMALRAMVDGAKEYGTRGIFQSASLSPGVLSNTMSALTSTVTETMVAMTEAAGTQQRQFRRYIKEPISNVGGLFLTDEWDGSYSTKSIRRTRWVPGRGWTPMPKCAMFHSEQAVGLALKIRWFGEGAERIVKEVREVNRSGVFVGPPMVAKDSKFIRNHDANDEKEFHKVFCKTQLKAARLANMFNKRVGNLGFDESSTPIIEFLRCTVYMIYDPMKGRHGYLVEPMLDIKSFTYQKWNDNAGGIRHNGSVQGRPKELLCALEEEEEETDQSDLDSDNSDDDDDSSEEEIEMYRGRGRQRCKHDSFFSVEDIPQAFSCFTYKCSNRKLLVCDLQGIYNTKACPPKFELTDPVIHYRSSNTNETKYGRTDKGLRGIETFVATHVCSNLCRMVNNRSVRRSDAVRLRDKYN